MECGSACDKNCLSITEPKPCTMQVETHYSILSGTKQIIWNITVYYLE